MKFDINLPIDSGKAMIKIDGMELKRVSGLQINAAPGEVPTIALKIIPDELNITGEGSVLRDAGVDMYSDEELLKLVAERIGSKIKL